MTVDTNMKYNDVKDKMFGFVTEVKINDRSLNWVKGGLIVMKMAIIVLS